VAQKNAKAGSERHIPIIADTPSMPAPFAADKASLGPCIASEAVKDPQESAANGILMGELRDSGPSVSGGNPDHVT
jgi:hypothetical protein